VEGENRVTATLCDKEFQQRIDSGERFGGGDTFYVRMRCVRSLSDGLTKAEYQILKVYQHTPAVMSLQGPLFPQVESDEEDES
jgi:hypothetical protein